MADTQMMMESHTNEILTEEQMKKMHTDLMMKISRDITSVMLIDMKESVGESLGAAQLEQITRPLQLFKALERAGIIRVGEYSRLVDFFKTNNQKEIVKNIEDTQKRMQGDDLC